MNHDHDYKVISNPNYVGPGQWTSIHTAAAQAKDEVSKACFKWFLNLQINGLKCEKCKTHALEYLSNHPLDEMKDFKMNGQEVGMLY